MKVIFSVLLLVFFQFQANSQFKIPELKGLNTGDKASASIAASLTQTFDVVITLTTYSVWGPDHSVKGLAHYPGGWYKIEINSDYSSIDSSSTRLIKTRLKDSVGDTIWQTLKNNHLFSMQDLRHRNPDCRPRADTVAKDGQTIVTIYPCIVEDGGEYLFEIFMSDNYKKLYFYEPEIQIECCPETKELQWISNCIKAFQKYLGN